MGKITKNKRYSYEYLLFSSDLFLNFGEILLTEFLSIFNDAFTERHNYLYSISDWFIVAFNQITCFLNEVLFELKIDEEEVTRFNHIPSEAEGFKRNGFAFFNSQFWELVGNPLLSFLVNGNINGNHDVCPPYRQMTRTFLF